MKILNEIISVSILMLISCTFSSAAGNSRDDRDWKERMQAEKVAYLTNAMELTPAEAEKFWPLYNQMEKDRKDAFSKVMDAFKALDEGLKAGKSEKETTALVNAYTQAVKESRETESRYTAIFSKVISMNKIGKMFIGEEEFRRQQICRWHDEKRQ